MTEEDTKYTVNLYSKMQTGMCRMISTAGRIRRQFSKIRLLPENYRRCYTDARERMRRP